MSPPRGWQPCLRGPCATFRGMAALSEVSLCPLPGNDDSPVKGGLGPPHPRGSHVRGVGVPCVPLPGGMLPPPRPRRDGVLSEGSGSLCPLPGDSQRGPARLSLTQAQPRPMRPPWQQALPVLHPLLPVALGAAAPRWPLWRTGPGDALPTPSRRAEVTLYPHSLSARPRADERTGSSRLAGRSARRSSRRAAASLPRRRTDGREPAEAGEREDGGGLGGCGGRRVPAPLLLPQLQGGGQPQAAGKRRGLGAAAEGVRGEAEASQRRCPPPAGVGRAGPGRPRE